MSAGEVVLAYLRSEVGALGELEAGVLVDAPDAVHRSRVATRRIRSTLRTFGTVFEPGVVEPVRDELRWLADEMGAARDAESMRETLVAQAGELPVGLRDEALREVGSRLDAAHAAAHAELVAAVGTGRYRLLRARLEALTGEPSLSSVATAPARAVLPPLYVGSVRRVEEMARRAAENPSDMERWHEVRKAAKVARYGAELLRAPLGQLAERAGTSWEQVTQVLGEVQNAVVAREALARFVLQNVADGRPVIALDELVRRQDAIQRAALSRGRGLLRRALWLDVG